MRPICVVLFLSACLGSKYFTITTAKDGVSVVVVNRTKLAIHRFVINPNISGDYKDWDHYPISIPPGGKGEIHVDPKRLVNGELGLSIDQYPDGDQEIYAGPALPIKGPTMIVIADAEETADRAPPGYTKIVLPSLQYKRQREKDTAANDAKLEADQRAARAVAAAKECAPIFAAPNARPNPGRLKIRGRFQCVEGSTRSKLEIVELADGHITATVQELVNANWVNSTWTGIVDGNKIRFTSSIRQAGYLEIDPKGHAMIGEIYGHPDDYCDKVALTCTN